MELPFLQFLQPWQKVIKFFPKGMKQILLCWTSSVQSCRLWPLRLTEEIALHKKDRTTWGHRDDVMYYRRHEGDEKVWTLMLIQLRDVGGAGEEGRCCKVQQDNTHVKRVYSHDCFGFVMWRILTTRMKESEKGTSCLTVCNTGGKVVKKISFMPKHRICQNCIVPNYEHNPAVVPISFLQSQTVRL